jgi:CRISPR-associated protein Cas5t
MDALGLYVSVPVASFRVPQAREFFETLPCAPPSTVYGMLLSLVGEPDRLRHEGTEIALALLSTPERSVVLRTLWRVKDRKTGPGLRENKRPDFQELLTGVELAVWTRPGTREAASPRLADRVRDVLAQPSNSLRFGGLSLGESAHLVDEVRCLSAQDPPNARFLVSDPQGDLTLPVWADHVGSAGTRWGQFRLVGGRLAAGPPENAWTPILSPETAT